MQNYQLPRVKDKRGFDLISDVLPFGRLWYGEPHAVSNAIGYAIFQPFTDAVIRVYDEAGNVIETHEQAGESSTYTRFGSTLTITGEREVP
jgi:YD repeat-containing protein